MAQFTRPVITQVGLSLMARVLANETTISFTRITTSSATYTPGQLETLTSLADIRQEILVAGTTIIDNTQVKITGAINNRDLTVGYQHSTTGFWAQDGGGNEILYAVSIVDLNIAGNTSMFIPPFSGGSTGLIFNVLLQIGNADQVILEPSPAALATARQVYDINNELLLIWDAMGNYVHVNRLGVANGVATLDGSVRLPNSQLPTSATANRVLRVGEANSNPVYAQVALGTDVSGQLPLGNAPRGVANTVLRGTGTGSNPAFGQVNLATDVTGTLASGNIGSHNHDAANINAGRLALARHATSGTANRVLRVGTANTDPVYGQVALGTDVSGQLPLGNAPRGAANTVLRGTGTGSNPAFGQVNLATDVTGTLASGNLPAGTLIGSNVEDIAITPLIPNVSSVRIFRVQRITGSRIAILTCSMLFSSITVLTHTVIGVLPVGFRPIHHNLRALGTMIVNGAHTLGIYQVWSSVINGEIAFALPTTSNVTGFYFQYTYLT